MSIGLTALCLVSIKVRAYEGNFGALYCTQRKVPTNFIPYISSLLLVLLSLNRLDPNSGPAFVKIGFNYMRYFEKIVTDSKFHRKQKLNT